MALIKRKRMSLNWLHCLATLILATFSQTGMSHTSSTAYLEISQESGSPTGTWKINLLDLNQVVPLDHNGDQKITWGEVKASKTAINSMALNHLLFSTQANAGCSPTIRGLSTKQINDAAYAVIDWQVNCTLSPGLAISAKYDFLFERDTTHVAIVTVGQKSPELFSSDRREIELGAGEPNGLAKFKMFLREGVWHIFIGYDHILFLLTMLLSVIKSDRRKTVVQALKVVTAFTVAHSATLFMVASGLIALPARIVETTIAFSIVVAAFNNIYPFLPNRTWLIAGCFGLIHGFGFASVLGELGLGTNNFALSVLAFNLGVEAGQIAIALTVLPILFFFQNRKLFQPVVIWGGSISAALMASIWLTERAFDVSLF